MLNRLRTILLLSLFAFPSFSAAQTYTFTDESTCTVKGGSTLRDWTATSSQVEGIVEFDKTFLKKKSPKAGSKVISASFQVPVKSLKGRADAMNTKIYKAFSSDSNPHIHFTLSNGTVSKDKAGTANTFILDCSGILNMAGASQEIRFKLTGTKQENDTFLFNGSVPMDMTSYGIKPPSAMFGQIIVEPEINIDFSLVLASN